MADAAEALLALEPDGLQLTPGNLPTADSASFAEDVTTLLHHGFSFTARRQPVWTDDGVCVADSDSVHPPRSGSPSAAYWKQFVLFERPDLVVETMYPGYELGSGDEVSWAMDAELWLAVDVSHLYLQRCAGVLSDEVLARVMDYERVAEVHVSHNAGRADTHRPLDATTFGLHWVRERLDAGTTVVLESYFHRLDFDDRRRQIDLVRG